MHSADLQLDVEHSLEQGELRHGLMFVINLLLLI
jgi:hypothetical protein